jgi:hypothetical protein
MINEEELRALMEKKGYIQERADEICALLYTGDFVHDIQEMIEACIALLNQAVGAISGAMSELAGIYYTPNPKKKHPRPPRCAGPRNKGRS